MKENASVTTIIGLPVWHLTVLRIVAKRQNPVQSLRCVNDEGWKKATKHILAILALHGIEYAQVKDYRITSIAGRPMPDESSTVKLVRAALSIQAWVHKMNSSENGFPFEVRMGMHTDIVIAGIVAAARMPADLYGHALHLADRLARLNEAGTITISEKTYNHISHLFDCAYLGSLDSMGEIHKPSKHIFDKAVRKIPHFRTGWVGMYRMVGEKLPLVVS